MEKKSNEFFFDQVGQFLKLPTQAWRRIVFFDFGANVSMLGVALSALFITLLVGSAGLFQQFGGIAHVFGGVHWLDLVALKNIDDFLQGPVGSFLSFLAIFSFFIGSFGVLRLVESVFDQQWGKINVHSMVKRIPVYWMALTIVPTFLAGSIGWALYIKAGTNNSQTASAVAGLAAVGQFVCTTLAFAALYKIINGLSVSYRSSFYGGFWAAVLFEIVKTALVATTTFQMTFSSPVGTFLVYSLLMCIGFVFISGALVFGNHVAYTDQNRAILEEMDVPHQKYELRPMREIALVALLEMTRRFYLKNNNTEAVLGLDALDLSKIALITPQRSSKVIRLLESVGLIKIIQDDYRETAILKIHPENLSLDEFIGRLEQRVTSKSLNVPAPLQDPSSTWFWQEYERALKDRFGSLSLKDLAELSQIMKKKSA